jgi:hypothetical protein
MLVVRGRLTWNPFVMCRSAATAGNKHTSGDRDSSAPPAKKLRTEPAAVTNSASSATVAVKPEPSSAAPQDTANLEESLDFDLEDLVGGPLVSASSSRFASIGRSNGTNGAGGANGYHTSGASNGGFSGAGGAAVKAEPRNSMGSAQVKVEPNTSTATPPNGASATPGTAAAAAGAKKVGMKPRPKIVIA